MCTRRAGTSHGARRKWPTRSPFSKTHCENKCADAAFHGVVIRCNSPPRPWMVGWLCECLTPAHTHRRMSDAFASSARGGVDEVTAQLLNTSLTETSTRFLPDKLPMGTILLSNTQHTDAPLMTTPFVLQVTRLRNVSAPSDNQTSNHAPRMLRIELTDGHSRCSAIEYSHHNKLDAESTPPGTKLMFTGNVTLRGGFIMVDDSVKVLGGHVAGLVEQWELQKSLSRHKRVKDGNGPPAFTPFTPASLTAAKANQAALKVQSAAAKPVVVQQDETTHARMPVPQGDRMELVRGVAGHGLLFF